MNPVCRKKGMCREKGLCRKEEWRSGKCGDMRGEVVREVCEVAAENGAAQHGMIRVVPTRITGNAAVLGPVQALLSPPCRGATEPSPRAQRNAIRIVSVCS